MTRPHGKTKGTVFIVDDDPILCRELDEALTSEGYATHSFAAGETFLDNVRDYPVPSVVLLDVLMNRMDGHEVHAELVEREVCVPVVFLTALGIVDKAVAALKLGAVDYLQKPADLDDIIAALDTALETDWERPEKQKLLDSYKSLTPREREVFIYSANGGLEKQIAGIMGISIHTVKEHRRNVKRKMGVDSIPSLTLIASDLGLVDRSSLIRGKRIERLRDQSMRLPLTC